MKRRVLLVDLDPQGNATTGAASTSASSRAPSTKCCSARHDRRRRVSSPTGGFDLVGANRELAGAEVELVDLPERETRLKDALAEALAQIIDEPPTTTSSCSTARRRCRC